MLPTTAATLPTIAAHELVARWNAAHAVRDTSGLDRLYADSVLYYGVQQSRDACVTAKRLFMRKHPDFKQALVGEVNVSAPTKATARATFIKAVTMSGTTKQYPSYLEMAESAHGWQVTVEGDGVTDVALQRHGLQTGSVLGDWDGDGKLDTLRLVPPKFPHTDPPGQAWGECEGPCNCTLVFAEHDSLTIENCIGGTPINEGDLDGRPGDEFGLLPQWWTSCWRGYQVFGLRGRSWEHIVDSISTHCAQWDDGVDAIEKDPAHPHHVIVRGTSMADHSRTTQSVRVR